jgi:hypothetical protein
MGDKIGRYAEIVEHLENAITLCDAVGEPNASSLIERALKVVKEAQLRTAPRPHRR